MSTDILTNCNDLNYWLAEFMVEIQKGEESGQFYAPNSVYQTMRWYSQVSSYQQTYRISELEIQKQHTL